MSSMLDPKIFNYVIMTLYALNLAQFAARGMIEHLPFVKWLRGKK